MTHIPLEMVLLGNKHPNKTFLCTKENFNCLFFSFRNFKLLYNNCFKLIYWIVLENLFQELCE